MSFSVEIRGLQKLSRKLKASVRTTTLINALTAGAFHIKTWIVMNRLTGPRPRFLGRITSRLATSISVIRGQKIRNNIIAKIGTNVIYAPIHEFGDESRNIPARPYLQPGIRDKANQKHVLKLLINRMKRAVEAQR